MVAASRKQSRRRASSRVIAAGAKQSRRLDKADGRFGHEAVARSTASRVSLPAQGSSAGLRQAPTERSRRS